MTPERRDRLFLAGVFLLALALRFLPAPAAERGGLRLLSPDCYGHLRRSHAAARHFPRVLVHDAYLNHPDGGVWIWPPAFDLLVGGAARVAHGADVTQDEVARVAAVLPPLLGALHVLPLFAFARRLLGRRRARVAAAVYALLPAAILWSCYGHADHHVAETLAFLLFLAAAARSADPAPPGRERAIRAAIAGAALGATLLVWQGSVFVAALGMLWALFALGPFAAAFGGAATLVAAAGTFLTLRGETVPFTFVSFGWFQPLLLAAGTLPLALLSAFHARTPRGRLAAGALAAAAALVVLPEAPRLAGAFLRGSAYVAKTGGTAADEMAHGGYLAYPADLIRLIAEARPLLSPPWGPAALGALRELSVGLVLLPAALAVWALALRRRKGARRDAFLLALLFGGTLLVMTLLQRRNVYYLTVFTALALAEAAGRLVRRGRILYPVGAAAAAVALLAIPSWREIAAYPSPLGRDLVETFRRLAALDPPPAAPSDLPQPAPGSIGGVMAPWAAGHLVTALAQRPAAADPFGYGWRRQARLFTTPDPEEALRILRAARCRYLVTMDLGPSIRRAYAEAGGNGAVPDAAMFVVRVHLSGERSPFPFLERVLDSRSGSRTPTGGFLPRFRVFRVAGTEDAPLYRQ